MPNIQLSISPTRDLAYFYPFLYTIILSCIQLSDIATGYSIWAWNWQSMMVGIKEIFGIAAVVGIVTVFCLCFSDLRGKYKGVIPKLPSLWVWSSMIVAINNVIKDSTTRRFNYA